MTGREANEIVGRIRRIYCDGLFIDVKVDDWKQGYGKDRFLVVPVRGSGSKWVNADSLLEVP